jgi:hypothetical protein
MKYFHFLMDFFGYNQVLIQLEYWHKIAFICPWGMFSYRKMSFGLNNDGTIFQWAMSTLFMT